MAQRPLKLGTRRSALARAQSGAIARQLEQQHPGLKVELVGIDTRGDRIIDRPLRTVEGKEFFTAEIDAALLRGEIDFTVHSFKDLSLERIERFHLAAVPRRAVPNDVVLFARDVPARLAAGADIVIGSSSPRRGSFVPEFLRWALPPTAAAEGASRVRLVELRGNVDSRLRRLHEPRGSERQLDGVVLAFAGIARLWAEESAHEMTRALLSGLPRMVVPLSVSPAAPAQGALALECRPEDGATAQLLSALDDAATRRATQAERALLAERGGGCQQLFGATQIEVPRLGTLLYTRAADERDGHVELQAPRLHWTPEVPLPVMSAPVLAWDGTRAREVEVVALDSGVAAAARAAERARALFVAHRRALPQDQRVSIKTGTPLWVPGVETWRALAERGIWVEGCADGLGFAQLEALLAEPWLALPPLAQWTVFTHAQAVGEWEGEQVIATYESRDVGAGPPAEATHLYWASGAQFERWRQDVGGAVVHACGPGKTYDQLRRAGLRDVCAFPNVLQWRQWLRL
jgi:hydroxymethylbilane synthase